MPKKKNNIRKKAWFMGALALAGGYFAYDYYNNSSAGTAKIDETLSLPDGSKVNKSEIFLSTIPYRYAGNTLILPLLNKSNLAKLSQKDFDFVFDTLSKNDPQNVGGANYVKIQEIIKKYNIS